MCGEAGRESGGKLEKSAMRLCWMLGRRESSLGGVKTGASERLRMLFEIDGGVAVRAAGGCQSPTDVKTGSGSSLRPILLLIEPCREGNPPCRLGRRIEPSAVLVLLRVGSVRSTGDQVNSDPVPVKSREPDREAEREADREPGRDTDPWRRGAVCS